MIDIKNLRKHYDEAPRGQAQGAQTDWLGFCKGGALLSTKWTFVRAACYNDRKERMIVS